MKHLVRMSLALWSACCLLTLPLMAQQRPRVVTNDDLRRSVAVRVDSGNNHPSGPAAPLDEVQPPPVPLTLPDLVTARLLSYSRSVQPHGIYFEALDGTPVLSLNEGLMYNPASVTKVMTSMAAR
jgi:D-alanyl-D-alanine carboxypeptidase/D-alanyl-D-alanine-endopeptidase (penicillin-binding protein 4)